MSSASSLASQNNVWEVRHVSKLPDNGKALAMLRELKLHIDPLLKARGFRVKRLYEICCCTSGGGNLRVGGFCCPAGDKRTSLRIALRLRHPHSHVLKPFETMLRILIHEVTHILHSEHSANFYAAMDELGRQYLQIREKGQLLDAQGFPMAAGRAVDDARHTPSSLCEGKEAALRAAEARVRAARALGGERLCGGGGGADTWRALSPREAAVRAAERRAADAASGLGEAELGAMNEPIELSDDEDGGGGGAAAQPQRADRAAAATARRGLAPTGLGKAGGPSQLGGAGPRGAALGAATTAGPILIDLEEDGGRKRLQRREQRAGGPSARGQAAGPAEAADPDGVIDLTTPPHSPAPKRRVPVEDGPQATGAARPPSIVWGARGEGKWQALCPVCGPVCMPQNHEGGEPPEQDEDEGANARD